MPKRITVGTYTCDIEKLQGHTALIYYDSEGNIMAQFDDMTLRYHGRGMDFGWHKLDKVDFKVRQKNDKGESARLPEAQR